MAGTLFGLGLSQQYYSGSPAAGALLYVYNANGTTPQTTYSDFSLSTSQTFPVVADSDGRLPQLWVADGSYRARLTTSGGVEIFDEASITAIGASSGTSGGGSSVDATTIFQTGDIIWVPYAGTRTGWVRANGRTIGSGSSSASERANSDTQSLFEYLWNNFSNTICAVSTGRGSTATADFNANKTLTLYSMRGRGMFGLDDMGNSVASVIAGGTPTAAGSTGGAETTSLVSGNIPAHTHGAGTYAVGAHTHSAGSYGVSAAVEGTAVSATGGSGKAYATNSSPNVTGTSGSTAPTFSGTSGSTGSGTAATTIAPYMLGSVYIKL